MKRKVSLSIGELQFSYGDERALEIAAMVGADGVDFGTYGSRWDYKRPDSPFALSDEDLTAHMTALRQKAADLGLEIYQTHGRLKGFCGRAEEDADILENARRDCLATAALGAPVCVMHGVATGRVGKDADPRWIHDLNFKMFNSILPHARRYGIKVATETFGDALGGEVCDFFGSCREFIPSFDRIAAAENGEFLTACMDTGHTNKAMRFYNNPSPGDFIRSLGPRLGILHLHDNNGMTDQHCFPFTGTINWKDVFDALDEVGYTGPYNLELNLNTFGKSLAADAAAFGIKVLRQMLLDRYGEE